MIKSKKPNTGALVKDVLSKENTIANTMLQVFETSASEEDVFWEIIKDFYNEN